MAYYIGYHASIEKGIEHAIYTVIENGGNALQIFLSPPQSSSAGRVLVDPNSIKQIIKNSGVKLVVHGKYILNYCRRDLQWQNDALIADLRKANSLGDDIGVIIHQGKNVKTMNLTREQALDNFVYNIQNILESTKDISNRIILENSCQQGTELGYTIEELALIFHKFSTEHKKRLGFCLDTCHAFVSGTLKMTSIKEVDEFFIKFDKLIGLSYLKVIHYNDSKTEFDGHNDHHEDILYGHITNTPDGLKIDGFKQISAWAKHLKIPLILETPETKISYIDQINYVHKWMTEVPEIDLVRNS